MAEGHAIFDAASSDLAEHPREVVDVQRQVVMGRDVDAGALEDMQLARTEAKPLNWKAELRGRDRFKAEDLDIEADRLVEPVRADADVIDADGPH